MTQRDGSGLQTRDLLGVAMGMALGAAAMYWLDPDAGSRRRVRAGQRTARIGRKARRFVGRATRDLAQRSRGVIAGARHSARDTDDLKVHERVRARIGHFSSHPRAIEVLVHGDGVTLRGPILTHEADRLIAAVRKVPGVACVFDDLERHDTAGNVPDLQGGVLAARRWMDRFDTPGFQMLAGIAGAAASMAALLAHRARSTEPSHEEAFGEGEENPSFYRHLATTPPMARSTREE